MTTQARPAQLGEHVTFRDHNGLPKAAIVTGTYSSIDGSRARDGGQVPAIGNADEVHLTVFPPTGGVECRTNIRRGQAPGQWEPMPDGYRLSP